MVLVGVGVFAGTSFQAKGAVAGDSSCGYGTTQFTESTVMRWAQVQGIGLTGPNQATFSAYGNDENSVLLGVNSATPMPSSTVVPQHVSNASGGDPTQSDGVTQLNSTLGTAAGSMEQPRPIYPALYVTKLSGPGGWTKPGDAIPAAAGDWQQGGSPVNLNGGTPYVDDVFGDWVVGTQTVSPSAAPGNVGSLANGPLSTAVNTTELDLQIPLTKTVVSGDSLVLAASGKTITFVANATANPGASKIFVTGKKSNFGYPNGTVINDTTGHAGDYARQSTLPTKNDWNLGAGSDPLLGTTFSTLGDEGYGTELRWNASGLKAYVPGSGVGNGSYQALQTGTYYKVQILEKDGDQNKGLGGDTGEFCTIIKIPGPPDIHTDPTGGTDPNGTNVDGAIKQWLGTTIKDTAFVPAKTGFGIPTGTVTFKLYFDAGNAPNPSGSCSTAASAPPGNLVYTDTETLDSSADPAKATSGVTTAGYDTSSGGLGTYYWQDTFTPSGSNASSYTTVTEACGAQTDQMVDARVRLTPHSAFNIVGNDHILSAFVETTTDGSSFTAVSGAPVTASLSPNTTSAVFVPNTLAGSQCTTSVHAGPPPASNPPAGTYCQVTIHDDTAETVFINATSTFTATGVTGGVNGDDSITRATDNKAACEADNVNGVTNGASCEAVKHFINPTTTLHVTDTMIGLTGNVGGSVTYTAYTGTDDATVLAACQAGTGGTDETVSGSNPFNGATAPLSSSVDVPDGTVVYYTATYSGNLGSFTSPCNEKASSG